jgi:hypothetical protein
MRLRKYATGEKENRKLRERASIRLCVYEIMRV